MFIVKHTIKTKATPAQIWKLWQDVESWKTWDHEIETCQLNGPFQTGTKGSIQFVGTPLFKTLLTHVDPFKVVVQETYLSCAKVISNQSMCKIDDQTQVTFAVEVRGPLSLIFGWMVKRFIKKKIPIEMEAMVKRALAIGE